VRVDCECSETPDELEGVEAQDFARGHLLEAWVNAIWWTTGYTCADSGHHWLMDFPHGELQGGGPPRLRRVCEAEFTAARDAA
jgi:hypothetical protein